jgi:hypothetical protein
LTGLSKLASLDLNDNAIRDLSPLVNNPGLDGRNDVEVYVSLDGNPLDCNDPTTVNHLAILNARAVFVRHDCQ